MWIPLFQNLKSTRDGNTLGEKKVNPTDHNRMRNSSTGKQDLVCPCLFYENNSYIITGD